MKPINDPPVFGAEVRRRREAQNITLEVLAERSGLTPNYIGGIELGRRDPSLSTLLAIARGLGVPLGELMGASTKVSPAALEMGRDFDALSPEEQAPLLRLFRALAGAAPKASRR